MKVRYGTKGLLCRPSELPQNPDNKVVINDKAGPVWAGCVGEVISTRTLTSLSQLNGENMDGLDGNCLVVQIPSEVKGKVYILHLLGGQVNYL